MAAHRSWLCSLVEQWGGLGLLEAMASQGILTRLEHWALRHARRCPYCQAQESAWAEMVRELKVMDGPAAPAHLLPQVLARIAREPRLEPASIPAGPAGQGRPASDPLAPWWPEWLDWSVGAGALAVLAGWSGALAAAPPAFLGAVQAVQNTARIWKATGAALAEGCKALAGALAHQWGALEPLLTAGQAGSPAGAFIIWVGAGLVNAAALVLVVARLVRPNG
ncbi:MAG TPA: hypothetical protein VIL08_04765 [Limnochorda sp.]